MATWNTAFEASPAGSDSPALGDDKIRELKGAVRERLDKEHVMDLTAGTSAVDGWHESGSAKVYIGADAPTTRPDGTTALTAADDGRLWIPTADSVIRVFRYTAGATMADRWIPISGKVHFIEVISGDVDNPQSDDPIPFSTAVEDPLSEVTLSTGVFAPAVSGVYHFVCRYSVITSTESYLDLYQDDSLVSHIKDLDGVGTYDIISFYRRLVVGEYVDFRVNGLVNRINLRLQIALAGA